MGKPALANIVAAFTMACALGADPEYVIAVLHQIKPVDNRLQVEKFEGITYLRDGYNSNPVGFSSALDVMKALPVKRRFVMTPGMIELGERQYKANKTVGIQAGEICDIAFVVGEENRVSLVKGLHEGGMSINSVISCTTREEAFQRFEQLKEEGDALLIENDLGDIYEKKVRF